MNCGRIRRSLRPGWNPLLDHELAHLRVAALLLAPGESHTLHTREREYALVLIEGDAEIALGDGRPRRFGPRDDPFTAPPHGLMVAREEAVAVRAVRATLIGVGSAPAAVGKANTWVTPSMVGGGKRGADNWSREVRFVCWTDNTDGNMLMAGETVTPSGNWSTIPPHRHQYDRPGEEAAYEEAYFFRFSRPEGFGLIWQFDDDGALDQAFSLRQNDLAYVGGGYHPVVCGPGSTLYHLTFMAGPRRVSQAAVHPSYGHILEQKQMANPFARQFAGPAGDSAPARTGG